MQAVLVEQRACERKSIVKSIGKNRSRRVPKRRLFAELTEGMAALAESRKGKRTLRTHAVEYHQ